MMTDIDSQYYPSPGDPITVDQLTSSKAVELVAYLSTQAVNFIDLIECRRDGENDVVVLGIEPEVPQRPVNDIARHEQLAVYFDHTDRKHQRVLALRRTFPRVMHTNVTPANSPVELCLYEIPYSELRLQWTAARFMHQLFGWLMKTARGELHNEDQPLEQLFIGVHDRIILPRSCSTDSSVEPLVVRNLYANNNGLVLIATALKESVAYKEQPSFTLLTYKAVPRSHGAIQTLPRTLSEFVGYLGEEGESFLEWLASKLKLCQDDPVVDMSLPLFLAVYFPKKRLADSVVESVETWAFATESNLHQVGAAIGCFGTENSDTRGGIILGRDASKSGEGINLDTFRPTPRLSLSDGAYCSGLEPKPLEYVAVGAGALGSQVLSNLVRMGQGKWTVVDKDIFLPHNATRHSLTSQTSGYPKAKATAFHLNAIYEEPSATPIVADACDLEDEVLLGKYENAIAILDLAASISVSRTLAIDVSAKGRRVSSFLSPSGRDSVFLAESVDRLIRLDLLEMEYYRAIVQDRRLDGHLKIFGNQYRYSNSCRDVSVRLPQDSVALHAAVAARQFRSLSTDFVAKVFRTDDSLMTTCIEVDVSPYRQVVVNGWTLHVSERLIRSMVQARVSMLPRETGGVLLGSIDLARKLIYVVDSVSAPPDSQYSETSYLRGCEGLVESLEIIRLQTGGQLEYVGEWHSHPGASTRPSKHDGQLFAWLVQHRLMDGIPALMAIVGEDSSRWLVKQFSKSKEMKHG